MTIDTTGLDKWHSLTSLEQHNVMEKLIEQTLESVKYVYENSYDDLETEEDFAAHANLVGTIQDLEEVLNEFRRSH